MSGNRSVRGKAGKNISILALSHDEAREFLLKEESYCNFDLPEYITFGDMLQKVDRLLNGKSILSVRSQNPRNYENLNHTILNNKDGKYAWRPMQLIHPAIYVSLVHAITAEKNWKLICKCFKGFASNKRIHCLSLPVKSLTDRKDKAEQILLWWNAIEQKSIELSLEYEYLMHTDITDCYGSIYTHSIAWALHTKTKAKKQRDDLLLGNIIDHHIQDMRYGQTNGIPQGSVLMDFIAEIVLGYADMEITKKIKRSISNYKILRYRDDYRIFVDSPTDGEKIVKFISEVMIDLGLKLNPEKTKVSNQVIRDSIKGDKLAWIKSKQFMKDIQKHLLLIHDHSRQHPNSGSLISALNNYHKRILAFKKPINNVMPLISILVDIAYHNPKVYSITSAILSKFLDMIRDKRIKFKVFKKIKVRFDHIPNTGHLQIWLQRISLPFTREIEYDEPICKLVYGENIPIWNMDWISAKGLKQAIQPEKIVNKKLLKESKPVISMKEVELFIAKSDKYHE